MELQNLDDVEKATRIGRRDVFRLGMALLFIVGILLFTNLHAADMPGGLMMVIAAMIGGYMALNIGANDVANNVGPAVGAKALTLAGAIGIAAVFEASGALIAGGDVVGTIKKNIIDPSAIGNSDQFIWLMTAALLAGAIWLNIATAVGAPVSTTHSIVGGVLGAGIAAGGWGIANWAQVGAIAASWVISPVLGGAIAAGFLYLIKRSINYQSDQVTAARRVVPVLISIMVWAFSTYLILKGVKHIWKASFYQAIIIGLILASIAFVFIRRAIGRVEIAARDAREGVNSLFTLPLICAAALLSFAHGANDVANAVGPLAAINDAVISGQISGKAGVPIWVMAVGAIGISLGLWLYGPKLIRTVGSEITELDKTRAFCIALAAAITVIIASQLGLPVSSTHITVGGVMGIGILRERIKVVYARAIEEIRLHHRGEDQAVVETFLTEFNDASFEEKRIMLKLLKKKVGPDFISKAERKNLRKVYRQELVKRAAVKKIIAAWLITVPVSGVLAAIFYFTLRGMMLP